MRVCVWEIGSEHKFCEAPMVYFVYIHGSRQPSCMLFTDTHYHYQYVCSKYTVHGGIYSSTISQRTLSRSLYISYEPPPKLNFFPLMFFHSNARLTIKARHATAMGSMKALTIAEL